MRKSKADVIDIIADIISAAFTRVYDPSDVLRALSGIDPAKAQARVQAKVQGKAKGRAKGKTKTHARDFFKAKPKAKAPKQAGSMKQRVTEYVDAHPGALLDEIVHGLKGANAGTVRTTVSVLTSAGALVADGNRGSYCFYVGKAPKPKKTAKRKRTTAAASPAAEAPAGKPEVTLLGSLPLDDASYDRAIIAAQPQAVVDVEY
jgi:hypothetical protein